MVHDQWFRHITSGSGPAIKALAGPEAVNQSIREAAIGSRNRALGMTRNGLANGRDRVKLMTIRTDASVDALVLRIHQNASVVHHAVLGRHTRIQLHGGRTAANRHGLGFRCKLDSLLNRVHIGPAGACLCVPIKLARLREQDRAKVMTTPRVVAVDPAVAPARGR